MKLVPALSECCSLLTKLTRLQSVKALEVFSRYCGEQCHPSTKTAVTMVRVLIVTVQYSEH